MKKQFALLIGLVLLVGFAQIVTAGDLPKQGTFSLTIYGTGTWKAIAMGKERLHATYDGIGIVVNDAGGGFLNNAANYFLGQMHGVNGIKEYENGFHVFTDADGDKAYATFDQKGVLFQLAEGTFTFVGGTGKYTGITGGGESRWTPTPMAKDDVYHGVSKMKGHYKHGCSISIMDEFVELTAVN